MEFPKVFRKCIAIGQEIQRHHAEGTLGIAHDRASVDHQIPLV
jgi:hypothetical protein